MARWQREKGQNILSSFISGCLVIATEVETTTSPAEGKPRVIIFQWKSSLSVGTGGERGYKILSLR